MFALSQIPDIHYSYKLIEQLGLQEIGSGSYASIYRLSFDTVLKVLDRKDYGYLAYITTINTLSNPYYPKVYSIHTFASGHKAVVLEKLDTVYSHLKNDENALDEYYYFIKNIASRAQYQEYEKLDYYTKDLLETLELIRLLAKDKGYNLDYDLFANNFMKHPKTDALVCIDPFYENKYYSL